MYVYIIYNNEVVLNWFNFFTLKNSFHMKFESKIYIYIFIILIKLCPFFQGLILSYIFYIYHYFILDNK